MSMSDPLGDMLTRIRNAQMRGKAFTISPFSRLCAAVLDVLVEEGYIRGYTVDRGSHIPVCKIELKYYFNRGVIRKVMRVSKPGRRLYASVKDDLRVANGLGVTVISTSKGVLSDHAAREARVGGEVLCRVF